MRSVLPFVEYYLRPVPGFSYLRPVLDALALRHWLRTGSPPAPRTVKRDLIRGFASARRRVFIETGTFYGDMLAELQSDFDALYSIELSPRLAKRAAARFAGDPRVRIVEGDSGEVLGRLLSTLQKPAVLWLDGHYSGPLTARGAVDTPLLRELGAALSIGTIEDAILVDDARLLGVDRSYPTELEVRSLIRQAHPEWTVTLVSDVVIACAGCP